MNRKYILLRRILGISTILLGLLIAILPMFGRAAEINLRVNTENYSYPGAESISATLDEGKDGYGLVLRDVEDTYYESLMRDRFPDASSFAIVYMFRVDQYDQFLEGDFGMCHISMPNPIGVAGDKESFSLYYYYNNMLVPLAYTSDGTTLSINFGFAELYNYSAYVFFIDNDSQEEDPTITGTQTPTSGVTDTPTVAPSQTQRPTVTPTPTRIPTSTPTPTSVPVRIPAIDDQRSDRSDTKGISSFLYGGSMPNSILIVRDSDGVGIKRIVVLRKGMILKPWHIRLVDENKRDITDFKSITITLPIPSDMNLKRGRVIMLGRRRNGKLHTFDTKIVTKNGYNCVEFTTDYFSDYEYGMLYTPDDGGEEDNKLNVSDEREDKEGTQYIDGSVTEGSGKRTLHIADSDGVIILRRIVW